MICWTALLTCTLLAQAPPEPKIYQPAPEERRLVEQKTAELEAVLRPLRSRANDDQFVDAEVYLKAAQWILRYGEFYTKAYVAQTLAVLETGLERARQLAAGRPAWPTATGCLSRAYRSRVDGSVQPYAVTVPPNYNPNAAEWLEVILHGRGATLNEVSFLYAHDRAVPLPSDHELIRLDVYGRGNNAYRWAGETDVFEAIESVRRRYNIDPDRIVLRGFSMGGAGAWHIGLHYPDKWAAVEAGAGFVETQRYARVADPPPYVHIYDALDYALNAVNVPTSGYGGELDPQRAASVAIRQALEKAGYTSGPQLLFLTGPNTQHAWHPDSKRESDAFMLRNQSRGIVSPAELRFVTYTERYNHAFHLTIDQLERQYQRAQVDFGRRGDVTTSNVARMTIDAARPATLYRIDGREFTIDEPTHFARVNGTWRVAARPNGLQKAHGLQGPIDDAFMDSFLCVRSANDELDRFAAEFSKWMRGEVRIKPESSLTSADVRAHNLIVFGTPTTSRLIARAVASSPIQWTTTSIVVGRHKFDASKHVLSMIYPNPARPTRYIVINSGHTFHEADFKGTNALLYPRAGDWAVTDKATGKVVAEGIFNRYWRLDL